MGVNYSQPPRGYQYSVVQNTGDKKKNCRNDPTLVETGEFSSCQELFKNNWENEKHLPYICEIGPSGNLVYHTFEEFDQKMQNIKPELMKFNRTNPLGIYSFNNFHTLLIYDTALFNEIPVLASGPNFQTPQQFIDSAISMNCGAIYCDKSLQKELQSLTKIPLFSDVFHIPAFPSSQKESNNEEEDNLENEYNVVFADNIHNKCRSQDLIKDLSSWAKRMKICRDARVVVDFPIGHNLNRLIRFVCISQRSLVCIPQSLEHIKQFAATHFFSTQETFISIIKNQIQKKQDKGFLYNFYYYPYYGWKNIKMSLGGTSEKADSAVFNKFKEDFGIEMRFCFTDKLLDPSLHQFFTITNTLPLSIIFSPEEWVNYGTCLPPDPRFTKYGTVGGPVGCSITTEENQLICSKSKNILDIHGKWDEEGSLVLTPTL